MTQVNLPYVFQNQTTADANQVDQNFNAITSVVNGLLSDDNMKAGSLSAAIATEGVKATQTIGIPYNADIFGTPFLFNGFTITKDGTYANQIDVAGGIAILKQPDGTLRRFVVAASQWRTTIPSTTYYLDLNSDSTWSWAQTHSTDPNYINVATVTSDASANVNTITPNGAAFKVTILNGATGPVSVQGLSASGFNTPDYWL